MLVRIWSKGNALALLVGMQTVWRFLKKLKIGLPYDPAVALLGIYPRDTGILMHRGHLYPNV